jgi:hypothetical protein
MPVTTCYVNDVEFSVEYHNTKYRAATLEDPPEYPETHIMSIMLEGTEVTELLAEWVIDKIVGQIDLNANDEAADLADHLFEQQREQRLFKD